MVAEYIGLSDIAPHLSNLAARFNWLRPRILGHYGQIADTEDGQFLSHHKKPRDQR